MRHKLIHIYVFFCFFPPSLLIINTTEKKKVIFKQRSPRVKKKPCPKTFNLLVFYQPYLPRFKDLRVTCKMARNSRLSECLDGYKLLPDELRVMIAEKALPLFRDIARVPQQTLLTRVAQPLVSQTDLALIDRAWKEAVEKRLFETLYLCPSDLVHFERICVGPRRAYVKNITFKPIDIGRISGDVTPSRRNNCKYHFGPYDVAPLCAVRNPSIYLGSFRVYHDSSASF